MTALNPESRYEKMAEAFGGAGFYVKTKSDLEPALKNALIKVKNG